MGNKEKEIGTIESVFVNVFSSIVSDVILQEQKDKHVNETHQLPCLKRKLVHNALLCIWSVDKKQIRQKQCMELIIVTFQGGVLFPEMLSTDCNHWKVTNIKLNLILQEEN